MKKQVLKIKMVTVRMERRDLNHVTWQYIRWADWWKAEEKESKKFLRAWVVSLQVPLTETRSRTALVRQSSIPSWSDGIEEILRNSHITIEYGIHLKYLNLGVSNLR